ncbi:MAG: hypothetical protein ACKV22_35250 [Bryobacteraceae bacterium]
MSAAALWAGQGSRPGPLAEHGFWDYTTPGAGGMEAFQWDDYASLIDDMANAGMNSLMIYVKWLTTGYRSRLPFQDQLPGNPVIASDNELLRRVIAAAGKRGIRVWLGAAVTYFEVAKFGSEPYRTIDAMSGFGLPIKVGLYDSDTPGLIERIVEIYEELVDLFPGISGLNVELEGAGVETPRRIARYEQWAREKGRAPFEKLGHPLNPRTFDAPDWRDYTTESRLRVLVAVEAAVRRKGFRGGLSMICETGRGRYAIGQEVNLDEFHKRLPHWIAVTYEYDKWNHRYAMMDLCIDQPKTLGIPVFYLPRGVMTWGRWPLPVTLEESWRLDIEDIRRFRPNGVWWFGCGTANEGAHVSAKRLKQSGYSHPVEARRALLKLVRDL